MSTAALWMVLLTVNAALWAVVGLAVLLLFGQPVVLVADAIGTAVLLAFIGVLRLVAGPG